MSTARVVSAWWRLHGYVDPEGKFEGGEVVCSIEACQGDYYLLVAHDGELETRQRYASAHEAVMKAEDLRAELLAMGWTAETAPIQRSVLNSTPIEGELGNG